MTSYFLQNLLLGKELTPEQMADIPYPRAELHVHVAYKCVQAFSILGMGVVGPVVGIIRGRSLAAVRQYAVRYGRNSIPLGLVFAPIMTEGMLSSRKATPESIYDRSYRIRHNVGQVRADRFATYGGIGGGAFAGFTGGSPLTGGIIGFAAGTVMAGVYTNSQQEKKEVPVSPESEKKDE